MLLNSVKNVVFDDKILQVYWPVSHSSMMVLDEIACGKKDYDYAFIHWAVTEE